MLELTMPTLQKLLTVHPELITRFGTSVKIENPPYMALCVENIGLGPRSQTALSVAHYGEQNGDLMRDPEMCFELEVDEQPRTWVDEAVALVSALASYPEAPAPAPTPIVKEFHPYYIRNDYVGMEQHSVVYHGHDADNKPTYTIDLPMMKGQREFARIWDRNLAAQGFEAAFEKSPELSRR